MGEHKLYLTYLLTYVGNKSL